MPISKQKTINKNTYLGVWEITEQLEELKNMLQNKGFDEASFLEANNEQRVKQWLATRLLLNYFFNDVHIIYDELGKPSLDNGWFISISHSNEYVAIIINKINNCGIDIEKISPKVERIKHKFLNELDLKNIISEQDLTLFWGAKEALYKYYGKKEVLFIENLFIENFSKNTNQFIGKIDMTDFKVELPMFWEKIEDYMLVYTL
jgi:phosphopantetheinyl transferase